MTLFESSGLTIRLCCSQDLIHHREGAYLFYSRPERGEFREVRVEAAGEGRILWPNREGEAFSVAEAFKVMEAVGARESGLSLAWPSTAAFPGALFMDGNGGGVLVAFPFDKEGRVVSIKVESRKTGEVSLRFTGSFDALWAAPFRSLEELAGRIGPFLESTGRSGTAKGNQKEIPWKRQFQVGLIDPWGKTEVPPDRGFLILEDMAERFSRISGGTGDTLHVFGYGAGHDREYPDYSPAPRLGGSEVLARAAEGVKRRGFELSFYLNARIVDRQVMSRYPGLAAGVLRDDRGEPVEEVYQDLRFWVMDPGYEPWQDVIVDAALTLKGLGADWIQLDQVAGRQPPRRPGEPWGEGYEEMIRRIRAAGMKVWTQGVCDYYSADRFEMTHRDVSILPGGILRGGNPLGEQAPELAALFLSDREFLVPREKARSLDPRIFPRIVVDMLTRGEILPLYGGSYLEELDRLETEILSSGNV